jgi:hypothetical protein
VACMQAKPVTLAAMYVGFKTFCWTFVGSMLIGQCSRCNQKPSTPCKDDADVQTAQHVSSAMSRRVFAGISMGFASSLAFKTHLLRSDDSHSPLESNMVSACALCYRMSTIVHT